MASTQETEAEEVKQTLEVFAFAVEKMKNASVLDELRIMTRVTSDCPGHKISTQYQNQQPETSHRTPDN